MIGVFDVLNPVLLGLAQIREPQLRPATALAQDIVTGMHCNTRKPGFKRRTAGELIEILKGLDEDFLCQVFGISTIAGIPIDDSHDPVTVQPHQVNLGSRVTILGALDEFVVIIEFGCVCHCHRNPGPAIALLDYRPELAAPLARHPLSCVMEPFSNHWLELVKELFGRQTCFTYGQAAHNLPCRVSLIVP
ncbi:MAG: hypothetical protein BWY87_00307 [Deltaproteobacteria bacterium ADurb.Bin510]|nr:MAG: hypothetical protein BWY87_00307 [Deltaproteobacteria bacterium ADurb.Bin510]